MSVLLHHQGLNASTPRHQYTLSNVRTSPSPRNKRINTSTSVYFIKCPYYSITKDKRNTPRHQYTLSSVRTTPSPRIKRINTFGITILYLMSVLLHHQGLNVYTPRHQYTLSSVRATPSPRIKRINPSASVYFITCPYYSITKD